MCTADDVHAGGAAFGSTVFESVAEALRAGGRSRTS